MSHDDSKDSHSVEIEEDVYVVEEIKEKRVKDGKVQYKIKWQDYPEQDCTWEEEENVLDKDMVREFEKKIGILKDKKKKAKSKNERSIMAHQKSVVKKNFVKPEPIQVSEIENRDILPSEKITTLNHLTKFAENIEKIECVFRVEDENKILAYVILKNKGRSVFPVSQLRELAPYKLIDYYESKLKFADSDK